MINAFVVRSLENLIHALFIRAIVVTLASALALALPLPFPSRHF